MLVPPSGGRCARAPRPFSPNVVRHVFDLAVHLSVVSSHLGSPLIPWPPSGCPLQRAVFNGGPTVWACLLHKHVSPRASNALAASRAPRWHTGACSSRVDPALPLWGLWPLLSLPLPTAVPAPLLVEEHGTMFFLRFYIFIHETHRSRDPGRGRSRLPAGTDVGLDPRTLGSRPGPEADAPPQSPRYPRIRTSSL